MWSYKLNCREWLHSRLWPYPLTFHLRIFNWQCWGWRTWDLLHAKHGPSTTDAPILLHRRRPLLLPIGRGFLIVFPSLEVFFLKKTNFPTLSFFIPSRCFFFFLTPLACALLCAFSCPLATCLSLFFSAPNNKKGHLAKPSSIPSGPAGSIPRPSLFAHILKPGQKR